MAALALPGRRMGGGGSRRATRFASAAAAGRVRGRAGPVGSGAASRGTDTLCCCFRKQRLAPEPTALLG